MAELKRPAASIEIQVGEKFRVRFAFAKSIKRTEWPPPLGRRPRQNKLKTPAGSRRRYIFEEYIIKTHSGELRSNFQSASHSVVIFGFSKRLERHVFSFAQNQRPLWTIKKRAFLGGRCARVESSLKHS